MPTPAEPDFVFGRDHLSIWVNEFHLADDTVGSFVADFDLHHVDALSFSSPWLGKSTQDMLSVIGAPQHRQHLFALESIQHVAFLEPGTPCLSNSIRHEPQIDDPVRI